MTSFERRVEAKKPRKPRQTKVQKQAAADAAGMDTHGDKENTQPIPRPKQPRKPVAKKETVVVSVLGESNPLD
ncbi:hypothetical protein KC19_VG261100 [Ceratodon purpureus]|uniref:Uncharacterized protein n=1 Tax=Ceratodon purpureus TaxID=3225 RepID=A0A8T0HTX5_CERPU|nr:hypothetical protein KC19_VG261100 [Ceratodon purpureus]